MKKSTILFLLFFALACTFLGFGIGRRIYNRPSVETKDTIFRTGFVYIPDPELIDVYIPTPPIPIDTTAIINDYLKAKVYNDTLISNSEITAVLEIRFTKIQYWAERSFIRYQPPFSNARRGHFPCF